MKTKKELAEALQHHRKLKGMGQKDMRMRIGMSQQQYQRAESGSDLRVSTLLRILEGLDLELKLVQKHESPNSSDSLVRADTQERESAWKNLLGDIED